MPYIYSNVEALEGTSKIGSGACPLLVQHYAHAPQVSRWKEGARVIGNTSLAKGTAIATFVNGTYPSQPHNNHAAIYISQDANGITVMDQWTTKAEVSSRYIIRKGKSPSGGYIDPSNNADAFSAIK